MSIQPVSAPRRGLIRGIILLFALVLGCQATWILAAEFYRPALRGFPAHPPAVAAAAVDQSEADLAASLGVVRGDLWAEDALTNLDLLWNDNRSSAGAQMSAAMERGRDVAVRAIKFSPHDARVWLVLAAIELRFDWLNRKAAAALRMSYYTGANEIELVPMRLLLAVRSEALGDTDFQQLVRHDIRAVATRRPDLKPAIVAAYRDAPPAGRQFIEDAVEEIDPAWLARLRSSG